MRHLYHHRRKQQLPCNQLYNLTFLCIVVGFSLAISTIAGQVGSLVDENVQFGSLNQSSSPLIFLPSTQEGAQRFKTTRLSGVSIKRDQNNNSRSTNGEQPQLNQRRVSNSKRHEDIQSTDCLAKRNEILSRQVGHQQVTPPKPLSSSTGASSGYQRLKPKLDTQSSSAAQHSSLSINETQIGSHFDGEHVPKCNQQGGYEPVQCHKIGYCWCVNKYGQAIKNTAVMAGEEPFCDASMYESDSNDWVVVAGVSAQKMIHFLKNTSSFESTTPNGHLNFEAPESTTNQYETNSGDTSSQSSVSVDQQVRAKARGPIMPLIPNDCKSSRDNARERAHKHMNDSIWIPDCDTEKEQLYAERQCHRSRVCWCVDQSTGLPLRASEQLTARSSANNCTELRKLIELSSQPKPQAAFYMSSSEHCDADKRVDFIVTLNSQFRQQISEYIRQNPTSLNSLPAGISSTNPFAISEAQVSKWKFTIMDRDADGKLGDREWSKFKNNFKLVDRVDELDNPFKQQKSPYFSLTPLLILRTQRKCWRDFLEFCGSGDLLIDESISLAKWHSCTEVPSRATNGNVDAFGEQHYHPHNYNRASSENTYAHSREAAITRSKKKNPFLQILKPD